MVTFHIWMTGFFLFLWGSYVIPREIISVSNICCNFPSVCASSISSAHNDVRFNVTRYHPPSDTVTALAIILLFLLLPWWWLLSFGYRFDEFVNLSAISQCIQINELNLGSLIFFNAKFEHLLHFMYLLLMWFCISLFEMLTPSKNSNGFSSIFLATFSRKLRKYRFLLFMRTVIK